MNQLTPQLKKYLVPLLVLLVLLGVYALWGNKSYITVTGVSESALANQKASFTAFIESRNAEKQAAATDLSERTESLLGALREFGFTDENLETTHVNVFQEQIYDQSTGRSTPGDWIATGNIEIKLDDVSRTQELTELLVTLDVTNYYGPNFTVGTENIDQTELLIGAYENARNKAEAMAEMRGMRLGKMVSLVEGSSSGSPIMYDRMEGLGGGGMPIEPGTSDVAKSVTVTFELRPF